MAEEIKGALSGKGRKFALVLSRTNEFVTNRLLEGAVDTLVRQEVADGDITVVYVPGSFEIPPAARRLAESGKLEERQAPVVATFAHCATLAVRRCVAEDEDRAGRSLNSTI